jgi:ABC-type antimicrobial peptide transport system permease subunit
MGLFAWIALLLAAIGLYAVTSYDVRQSTREIGIRLALGAGRLQVLAAAAGRSVRLAVLGFLLGLGVALLLARLLRNLLEGLGEADPLTLAAVGLLLLVVVLGASTLAARRALRIEPTETLRLE